MIRFSKTISKNNHKKTHMTPTQKSIEKDIGRLAEVIDNRLAAWIEKYEHISHTDKPLITAMKNLLQGSGKEIRKQRVKLELKLLEVRLSLVEAKIEALRMASETRHNTD